jgi:hypothetical protein
MVNRLTLIRFILEGLIGLQYFIAALLYRSLLSGYGQTKKD